MRYVNRAGRRQFLGAAAWMMGGTMLNHTYAQTSQLPAYRGNQHRPTTELLVWHQQATQEVAQAPNFPIVDAHHHLFNERSDRLYYLKQTEINE